MKKYLFVFILFFIQYAHSQVRLTHNDSVNTMMQDFATYLKEKSMHNSEAISLTQLNTDTNFVVQFKINESGELIYFMAYQNREFINDDYINIGYLKNLFSSNAHFWLSKYPKEIRTFNDTFVLSIWLMTDKTVGQKIKTDSIENQKTALSKEPLSDLLIKLNKYFSEKGNPISIDNYKTTQVFLKVRTL